MVYELVKLLRKPFGVVLNKCLPGENPAKLYCQEMGIPILAEIPYEEELGACTSKGVVAVRESKRYRDLFCALLDRVQKEVSG
jgi:MinD superfamily P-loop ATPase